MFERVIAIDSAGDTLGLAASSGGELLAATELQASRRHVESLLPQLDLLLQRLEWRPEAIDLVAVAAGPGSFTGLRVGLAAAKGLCVATDAALVLVPSLAARAQTIAQAAAAPPELVIVAEDARKSRVYTQLFRIGSDRQVVELTQVVDIAPDQLTEHWSTAELPRQNAAGCSWMSVGSGAHLVSDAAAQQFGAAGQVSAVSSDQSTVRAVVALGRSAALDGRLAGQYAAPNYLRSGDIGNQKRYPRFGA